MGVMIALDRRYQNVNDRELRRLWREMALITARKEFSDPETRPRALQERWDALVGEFRVRGIQLSLFR